MNRLGGGHDLPVTLCSLTLHKRHSGLKGGGSLQVKLIGQLLVGESPGPTTYLLWAKSYRRRGNAKIPK